METDVQTKLINHISRLEGQLSRVKRELQNSAPDCAQASDTLLSASRSFAGLRVSFIDAFLNTYGAAIHKESNQKEYKKLLALIKG